MRVGWSKRLAPPGCARPVAPEGDEQRILLADQRTERVRRPREARRAGGRGVPETVEQPVLLAAAPMRETEASHRPG